MTVARWVLVGMLGASASASGIARADEVVVGSKNFTEGALLGEIIAQRLEEATDLTVVRRLHLGGTMVCWTALRAGEIDVTAEYTGTAWSVLLNEGVITDAMEVLPRVHQRSLAEFGVRWLEPFGLDNTYALAMTETRASTLSIHRISDLVAHQEALRGAFTPEFLERADGYPGLAKTYGLALASVSGMEHALAYQGVRSGDVDVIDAYSTDGKLLKDGLRVLVDDLGFFPPYQAAPLVREAFLVEHPEVGSALRPLAYALNDETAQVLNYAVDAGGFSFAAVASAFLEREGLREARGDAEVAEAAALVAARLGGVASAAQTTPTRPGFFDLLRDRKAALWENTKEHVRLTSVAVVLAALISIPLGVVLTRRATARRVALGVAGVLQTVPGIALLAFMIPLLGLSEWSAITALFLYAILPILRNTCTGLLEVDRDLVDAARGMGLKPREILWRVELPLAMPTLMAGVRTSAVISVGVATLAAFIGAGGFGEPIVTGLTLDYPAYILTGAVPAALLAVVVDAGLGWVERRFEPRPKSAPITDA